MKTVEAEEEEKMQIVVNVKPDEARSRDTSAAQSRLLLWACAGLLETLCLLGGMYWIMNGADSRPLALRVTLVAALAVVCGVGTVVAYLRFGRET